MINQFENEKRAPCDFKRSGSSCFMLTDGTFPVIFSSSSSSSSCSSSSSSSSLFFYMQRCYYISMEFYMGRSLTNAMVNLGIDSPVEEALYEVHVCTCMCTMSCCGMSASSCTAMLYWDFIMNCLIIPSCTSYFQIIYPRKITFVCTIVLVCLVQ